MGYKVGVDPGTSKTGLCFFLNKKVEFTKTLYPPDGLDFLGKLLWQQEQFHQLLAERDIEAVAIEEWEPHHNRIDKELKEKYGSDAKQSMIMCATTRGVLIAVARFATPNVVFANKRQIKKTQTAMLAKAWGVTGSKDALDAFHIGVVAGFDR